VSMDLSAATSFGAIAPKYNIARRGYASEAILFALDGIKSSDRVLDLASGPGLLASQVLQTLPGLQVVALDLDQRMLDQIRAQGRLSGVAPIQARAEGLPFKNGSFDLVMIGTGYHWFERSDTDPEIARILRPGGRVVALWDSIDKSVAPLPMSKLWNSARQRGSNFAGGTQNGAPLKG